MTLTYDQLLKSCQMRRDVAFDLNKVLKLPDAPEFPNISEKFKQHLCEGPALIMAAMFDLDGFPKHLAEVTKDATTFDECWLFIKNCIPQGMPVNLGKDGEYLMPLVQKAYSFASNFSEMYVIHNLVVNLNPDSDLAKEIWNKLVEIGTLDDWLTEYYDSRDDDCAKQVCALLTAANPDTPAA